MRRTYSKDLGDVGPELSAFVEDNDNRLMRERRLQEVLAAAPLRATCTLCGAVLSGLRFRHRLLDMVECATCGHVQTHGKPPGSYPFDSGLTFGAVYPKLGRDAFVDRRDRIYMPKLEWMIESLAQDAILRIPLRDRTWVDLGAGAGYFLDALRAAGMSHIRGVEADAALVALAGTTCGADVVHWQGRLADAVGSYAADVYTAWFVLEHVEDSWAVWDALAATPPGTVFGFSVPVFGMATALESAIDVHSARNLDGVLHTQIYTETSIRWALRRGGLEAIAEWSFGQDAQDLMRFLHAALSPIWPKELIARHLGRLEQAADGVQAAFDHAGLCDARHVLAVRL